MVKKKTKEQQVFTLPAGLKEKYPVAEFNFSAIVEGSLLNLFEEHRQKAINIPVYPRKFNERANLTFTPLVLERLSVISKKVGRKMNEVIVFAVETYGDKVAGVKPPIHTCPKCGHTFTENPESQDQ